MVLDDLDIAILKILEDDARVSYRKIAQKLNVSVGTIHNRISKLHENEIIKGFLLELNERKLNYKLKTVISLVITGIKIDEILKKISNYPHVTNVYNISGSVSAIVICRFQKMKQIRDFTTFLNEEKDVLKVETNIVLNVYKEDTHHLLSFDSTPEK